MFSLIVIFKVHPGKKSDFQSAISPVIQATRSEEGNIEYRLSVDENDENTFFLYEIYKDRSAYEFHTQQSYLTSLRESLREILSEPTSVIRGPVIQV